MKSRPLAVALLLSLTPAVALPPRVALAQGTTDDASTRMARARFQEGVAFFDKHQYEQARAAFLQAYALRKHPVVLLNLAQSSLKSGHALEAARYFQQFLHEYSAATQAQKSDAEAGLTEAHQKLGRIDVSSAPAGAEVWIDDDKAGNAPFDHPIEVEPGPHAVGARGRGGDESVQVTAPAGQVVTARFGQQSAPPAAAVAPTPAPSAPAEAPPSESPPANDDVTPAPQPAPASSSGSHVSRYSGAVLGTGIGISAAGFIVAIVMGVEKGKAQDKSDSVASQIQAQLIKDNLPAQGACSIASGKSPPTPYGNYASACSTLHSDNNNVNSDALIANIGLGVGIAAGVFTVGYLIFGGRDTSAPATSASTKPTFTPMIGKGVGGLQLGASF